MSIKTEDKTKTSEKQKLFAFSNELKIELDNILAFWSTEAIDQRNGGFIGEIDSLGNKNYEASKGSVLNTRILWTFSAAYRTTKNINYKIIADRAYKYIISHFWDEENGGLFWEVDFLGKPINTRKQAYAQGFGIYAFSEYYRATKNIQSLKYAKKLFNILENNFYDENNIGYIEALKENWTEIDDMRLSRKDLNAPKSMNTHLHILEPYTNLFRIWDDASLKDKIKNLISIFKDKIIDTETGHFNLFFDSDWSKKSSVISFGHDIEGAWLLHEAAEVIQDESIVKSVQSTAINLVDLTLVKGRDTDGSLFNELEDNQFDKDKHWWVQAEAMVGLMDAFQINGNQTYLKSIYKIWEFIKNHLIDTKYGEWFWRIDENKEPNLEEDKLGFWKCPYHNSRSLMELIERIKEI